MAELACIAIPASASDDEFAWNVVENGITLELFKYF